MQVTTYTKIDKYIYIYIYMYACMFVCMYVCVCVDLIAVAHLFTYDHLT